MSEIKEELTTEKSESEKETVTTETKPFTSTPPYPFYRRRQFLIISIAAVLVLIIAGAAIFIVANNTPVDNNPIIIGVSIDQTGSLSSVGTGLLDSMQLAVNQKNQQGGVKGHQIKLEVYDDKSTVADSTNAANKILDSRALVEMGPNTSAGAVNAGAIYKQGKIPYVLPLAFADNLTQDNPYAFRTVLPDSVQGYYIAAYLTQVLKIKKATIIYTPDAFGNSFDSGFEETFREINGTVAHKLVMDTVASNQRPQSIQAIIDTLRNDPDPGMVILGVAQVDLKSIMVPLRRAFPNIHLSTTGAAGINSFNNIFNDLTEEQNQHGYFTEGMYALAPFILDSSDANSQNFGVQFQSTYGFLPDWQVVSAYDSMLVLLKAIESSDIQNTPASLQSDREQIRAQLEKIDSPDVAVKGISGSLYFGVDHNVSNQTIPKVGYFKSGQFISAPVQLHTVNNINTVDVWKELGSGNMVIVNNNYYWLQEVVYTGLGFNTVSSIDVGKGIYTSDFNLWFRYQGNLDPTQVVFPDSSSLNFDASSPAVSTTINGANYRLYHIHGDTKDEYDLHSYPFDKQTLKLRFRNSSINNERIVYVVDTFGLQPPNNGNQASILSAPFSTLQSWQFDKQEYVVDSLPINSSLGDPRVFENTTATEYSGLNLQIKLSRNYVVFLIKTLLPLILMTLVVYTTLYFPQALLKEQATVPVTAMLAATVLLNTINSQLTNIGYTTAIEYLFYIFFVICLACIITAIVIDRHISGKRHENAKRLRLAARIGYPVIVAAVVIYYLVAYIHN